MRALWFVPLALWLPAVGEVQNPRTSPADIAAGAKTFRSHCAPCHGYDGTGGLGPNLAAGRFYHGSTDEDLFNNISNGIAGTEMPGLFYSADRVWQIVAYVRSLNRSAQTPPPGDATRGEALFASKGCSRCHRVDGKGGAMGPDLSQIGASRSASYLRESIVKPGAEVSPRYWRVSFEDGQGRKIQGFLLNEDTYTVQLIAMNGALESYDRSALKDFTIDKRSAMPSYGGSLTSAELDDLVAYLWSLRPGRQRK
jgi:putative heme-binding domain-containing protein